MFELQKQGKNVLKNAFYQNKKKYEKPELNLQTEVIVKPDLLITNQNHREKLSKFNESLNRKI